MTFLASETRIGAGEAVRIAILSVEKRGMAFWEQKRKVTRVYEDEIKKVYFPYFIMNVHYSIRSRLVNKLENRQIMAMEGLTGEVGVVVGPPVARETAEDGCRIIRPAFAEDDARKRITDYMSRYFVRTKRAIPEILSDELFIIYKPAFIVPLDFEVKNQIQHTRKVIDAESGYVVYRYDLKEIL